MQGVATSTDAKDVQGEVGVLNQHSWLGRERRKLEIGPQETMWFQEKGITPEGPPPCAHHNDFPAWTAYVAWLLGQESLADDDAFRRFCDAAHRNALLSLEVARRWLQR